MSRSGDPLGQATMEVTRAIIERSVRGAKDGDP